MYIIFKHLYTNSKHMLERLLTSKVRAKILRLFFNSSKNYHLRELARILRINVNQAKRELDLLTSLDIIRFEVIGNSKRYSANKHCRVYKELRSIVAKDFSVEEELKDVLSKSSNINFAFIFGSYAKNKMNEKSDIDLMVVGEPDINALNTQICLLESKINRQIQYFVYTPKEFNKKKSYGFVKNVVNSPKKYLLGKFTV